MIQPTQAKTTDFETFKESLPPASIGPEIRRINTAEVEKEILRLVQHSVGHKLDSIITYAGRAAVYFMKITDTAEAERWIQVLKIAGEAFKKALEPTARAIEKAKTVHNKEALVVEGVPTIFYEQGMLHAVWAVDLGGSQYPIPLQAGDYIMLRSASGVTLYSGKIIPDITRCRTFRYDGAVGLRVEGSLVEWIPEQVDPVTWNSYFIDSTNSILLSREGAEGRDAACNI